MSSFVAFFLHFAYFLHSAIRASFCMSRIFGTLVSLIWRRASVYPFTSFLPPFCAVRHTLTVDSPSRLRNTAETCSFGPVIPPEVWGLIIYHACLLYYDPLDTSMDLSFFDLHSPTLQIDKYRQAMKLKMTVALVSKQWNALVRSGLYEFVWIGKAAQAKALARSLLMEFVERKKALQGGISPQLLRISSGSYIRRLHIETPVLERCSPADIRTILDFAPSLQIYSDHHSLQRSMFNDSPDPRSTPEELLKLVAHPKLRRLSWTTYGSVPFSQRIAPLIKSHAGALNLEYLELSSWSPNPRTVSPDTLTSRSATHHRHPMYVSLPALKALKVSLDNNTFGTLASWDMPLLTNLSVLSADFSYTGPGFNSFFAAHGAKLIQLELGHSSSSIEEYYLTTPHHLQQANQAATPISLATSCPNLKEVICSADAEWHWQSPDWITPHILLPFHPSVELIGIRDIDKRLKEDPDFEHAGVTPYFPLFEQLVSLLRRDAFPRLRFVRDLSVESHRMRLHAAQILAHPPEPSPSQITSTSSFSSSYGGSHPGRIIQFWTRVVEKCKERGVWCEEYTGLNLTVRGLMRAGLMAAAEEAEEAGEQSEKNKNKKQKRVLRLLGRSSA